MTESFEWMTARFRDAYVQDPANREEQVRRTLGSAPLGMEPQKIINTSVNTPNVHHAITH